MVDVDNVKTAFHLAVLGGGLASLVGGTLLIKLGISMMRDKEYWNQVRHNVKHRPLGMVKDLGTGKLRTDPAPK